MSILSRIFDPFGKKRKEIALLISYFQSQTIRFKEYTLSFEESESLFNKGISPDVFLNYADIFIVNEELELVYLGKHIVKIEDFINIRKHGGVMRFQHFLRTIEKRDNLCCLN